MQTYTHLVITAVLARQVQKREAGAVSSADTGQPLPALRNRWFLFGSVAPDLPLVLIGAVFILSDLLGAPRLNPSQANTGFLFDVLFFNAWWMKTLHNLFHAPILVAVYMTIGYWAWTRNRQWGAALFWFAAACMIHTLIDIPVHRDDGPLVFFPFDWTTRFISPISYWEAAYYGQQFFIFEHLLLLAGLVYLAVDFFQQRRARRLQTATVKQTPPP